jgi:hypothetical protein
MDGGVNPSSIFCNGNNTATATATPSSSSVRVTGASGSPTGSPTGSAGGSAGGSTGAAARGVSKTGLGMLGVVIVSVMVGVLL